MWEKPKFEMHQSRKIFRTPACSPRLDPGMEAIRREEKRMLDGAEAVRTAAPRKKNAAGLSPRLFRGKIPHDRQLETLALECVDHHDDPYDQERNPNQWKQNYVY